MSNWLTSETEILRRIASSRQLLSNSIHFALGAAFPHPEHPFAQNIVICVNVPRSKLDLDPKQKPGDIDYLVVPFTQERLMPEKAIAIEAKIIRPTISKPPKNANSMGIRQVKGLLNDGFPYVGLLHISVPEPMPLNNRYSIPLISNKTGPNGELIETGERMLVDLFPATHAARQEGRIIAKNLPDEVGYKVIAFSLSRTQETFSGNTMGESRQGKRNPLASNSLMRSISKYVCDNPGLVYRVRWHENNKS